MHVTLARPALAVALVVLGSPYALGQGMPTSQPQLLTITREEVKPGYNAEHARIEAGWPAAFERAKSPYYYIAVTSLTGPNEAWFISTFASHAAAADSMKREDEPVLAAELARLARADSAMLNGLRIMQATGRPDLSHGAFPDVGKMRFFEITWLRVRPGHEAAFEATAKGYRAAVDRATPNRSYRVYQVVAGTPGPTYLVFNSVASYEEFDKAMSDGDALRKAFTADENAMMQKFSSEGFINTETNRFKVDPAMSYVPKDVRAQDPAFWNPKKPAPKPSTQQQ